MNHKHFVNTNRLNVFDPYRRLRSGHLGWNGNNLSVSDQLRDERLNRDATE